MPFLTAKIKSIISKNKENEKKKEFASKNAANKYIKKQINNKKMETKKKIEESAEMIKKNSANENTSVTAEEMDALDNQLEWELEDYD